MPILADFPRISARPWPQKSPRHPEGMPPAVLEIPWEEQVDFSLHVLTRYHLTELAYQPVAHLMASAYPGLAEVSDRTFATLFSERLFGKFLNPHLDEADWRVFREVIPPEGVLYKADFSPIGDVPLLPGLHAAATVALFTRRPEGPLAPVAIHLDDLVLTPADGQAWELAKYFVLHGATCLTITGVHGLLHFPMDAVNAITKTALPSRHPISRLLRPHLRYSLMLDRTVLEHPRTLIDNDQGEVYTPFLGPAEGIRGLISTAYAGVAGNSSYPAYRFPLSPPKIHGAFGKAIEAYYACMLDFTRRLLDHLPAEDPETLAWADHLHGWVPGFPSGAEIMEGDTLARTLAFIMCDVSVMHAADHHDLAQIPLDMAPLRMRVPPPRSADHPAFDRRGLVTREDTFRHAMARELFVRPHNLTFLKDVDYRFEDPDLYRLNCHFLADLRDVDEQVAGRGFIPLDQIACSIQY